MTSALKEAIEFYSWVGKSTNGMPIPNRTKETTSARILQQSMDIGDAILLLLDNKLPGPAFTLARAHFETYVCGIWLFDVASSDEIERYQSGITPKIDTLIKKANCSDPKTHSWIKKNKELNLRSFHGLAHSGVEHTNRRISDKGNIEPSYQEEELLSLIKHSTTIQIGIAVYLCLITDNADAINNLQNRANDLCIIYP